MAADMRVSVTDLDGFSYFKNSELSIEDYVRRLKGLDDPGPRAELGTRFHEAVESFHLTGSPTLLDRDFVLPEAPIHLDRPAVTEMRVARDFDVGGGRVVTLSGRVDAISGLTVIDYKTSTRMDLESYCDAMQWRAYLALMPRMQHFKYEVFQLATRPSRDGRYQIREHATLALNRYDDLESDVHVALAEYDRFLRDMEAGGWIELTSRGVKRHESV